MQIVERAADRREFTSAIALSKTISEGIGHLTEFNFQSLKLGMHKRFQPRRKLESEPRKRRSSSCQSRECAYELFKLTQLLPRKIRQPNSFCGLQRFDWQ